MAKRRFWISSPPKPKFRFRRGPHKGGAAIGAKLKLARWAIPCYAAILLTFLHLSARSDFVERWRLQQEYQKTAGERLNQIESMIKAFDQRNVAFFEFAAGQYTDIVIKNCRGYRPPEPRQTNCSGASVDWKMSSSTHSTFTYFPSTAERQRAVDRVTSGVRALGPQLREYALDAGPRLPKLRQDLRTSWRSAFQSDPPLSAIDPVTFASELRSFARRRDALRRVAIWGLYNSPPHELASVDVASLGLVGGTTTFADIQPIRLKTGIEPFKDYLRHYIETPASDPDFVVGFSTLRQDWLRKAAEGQGFEATSPTLPLAGIQANLQDLSRLLPLLLLSFYGLYCTVYLGWLRSARSAPDQSDFPMFGFAFIGARLNPGSSGPWTGWIACISLPIGVLAGLTGLAVWPLGEGRGVDFGDELCMTTQDLSRLSCSSAAWPAVFGLLIATVLTCAVVRAEAKVLKGNVPGHWLIQAFAWFIAAALTIYATVEHLRFASGEFAQWQQEHFIRSANLWLPLATMIVVVAACRLRGGYFAVALSFVLIWLLPESPADLSKPVPEPFLGENCYGPACHIQ